MRRYEREIFSNARRLDSPEARAEYLRQVCGDNRDFLDRITALLRGFEGAGSFLESPPPGIAATIDTPAVAERPGQTIGHFKLLEEIGEGGMGVVYMAEQREPVRRKVALKIIKPGMDTREVTARFEAERQALAIMDHLNIAKVFDAGETASGRSYFVMELVRGISLVAWSPDGRRLASGAMGAAPDGSFEAKIWNATTGDEVLSLKGIDGSVQKVAWSPDGRQLATTGSSTTVRISDAATGEEIRTFRGHTDDVWTLAWSPDGKRLASGGSDGTIRIWEAARDPDTRILPSQHTIFAVAWSPDGRNLATSGGETVAVWDMATGKAIHLLGGHTGGSYGLAWSPDGKHLASAAEDRTIKIWDTAARQEIVTLYGHTAPGPSALAWSPNGHCLAAPNGKDVKIWDASIGYKLAASAAYRLNVAMRQGRLDEALAIFQRLAADFPDRPMYCRALAEAYCARGRAAFDAGDHKRALPDFDQAIRLDPENAEAYVDRGLAYMNKGDFDKAIADLSEAIRLDPKLAHAHAHRGWAYAKKGEYDKAIADCSEAIRPAQAGAAAPLEEPHEIRSAIEAEVAMVLAEVHWRLVHKDLARRWFDKAVVWMDKNKAEAESLRRIRAEAAKLLGIEEKASSVKQ